MVEAAELADYLPLSFKTPKEQEYIKFLWDAFETNRTHGKYQFAFLAYRMLTMSFVSQHLADQTDDAKRIRDGPDRLRQGHREEPVRHDFALRIQHRERTYPRTHHNVCRYRSIICSCVSNAVPGVTLCAIGSRSSIGWRVSRSRWRAASSYFCGRRVDLQAPARLTGIGPEAGWPPGSPRQRDRPAGVFRLRQTPVLRRQRLHPQQH